MPTLKYVGNAGRYRLTNSDVDVAQGETVTVDEETAAHLQEHGEFEVVGDGGNVRERDGPPDVPVLAEEATVAEIEDAVATIESADAIRYILEDEREGPNRTTAIDALEARLDELEE